MVINIMVFVQSVGLETLIAKVLLPQWQGFRVLMRHRLRINFTLWVWMILKKVKAADIIFDQ